MDLDERLQVVLAGDHGEAGRHIERADSHLRVAINELRQLAAGLQPLALGRGLATALAELADRSERFRSS